MIDTSSRFARMLALVQGLALALGSVLVALLLMEGATRLLVPEPKPPEEPIRGDLGYFDFTRPGARGTMDGGASYQNNMLGFRGPERTQQKPPRTFRILVGGDSVSAGYGVEDDQTYSSILEAKLRNRSPKVEVLNFGIPGIEIGSIITRIENYGLSFDPDLIVYGWTVNDIELPSYIRSADPKWDWVYRKLGSLPSRLLGLLAPRLRSLDERLRAPTGSYLRELNDNYNGPAWDQFVAALGRLERMQRRDRRVVVFLHADLHQLGWLHPFHDIYQRVSSAAEALGLPVIESFPAVRGRRGPDLWVSSTDPHPNPKGHELYAAALLEGLDDQRLLSPRLARRRARVSR